MCDITRVTFLKYKSEHVTFWLKLFEDFPLLLEIHHKVWQPLLGVASSHSPGSIFLLFAPSLLFPSSRQTAVLSYPPISHFCHYILICMIMWLMSAFPSMRTGLCVPKVSPRDFDIMCKGLRKNSWIYCISSLRVKPFCSLEVYLGGIFLFQWRLRIWVFQTLFKCFTGINSVHSH